MILQNNELIREVSGKQPHYYHANKTCLLQNHRSNLLKIDTDTMDSLTTAS